MYLYANHKSLPTRGLRFSISSVSQKYRYENITTELKFLNKKSPEIKKKKKVPEILR